MKKKNKLRGTGFSKGSFERMVEVNQGYNDYIDRLYIKCAKGLGSKKDKICEVLVCLVFPLRIERFRTRETNLKKGDIVRMVYSYLIRRYDRKKKYKVNYNMVGVFQRYIKKGVKK